MLPRRPAVVAPRRPAPTCRGRAAPPCAARTGRAAASTRVDPRRPAVVAPRRPAGGIARRAAARLVATDPAGPSGSAVDPYPHRSVVRAGFAPALRGVRADRRQAGRALAGQAGARLRRPVHQAVAQQHVVDQLAPPGVHPGPALPGRDQRGHVPQPRRIALVGPVVARSADLRAGRAEQDLRGRRLHLVVQVAQDGDLPRPPVIGQQLVRERAQRRRLGRPAVQGVGAVAGPFALVARLEPAVRIRQQLRLQMTDRHPQRPVPAVDLHGQEAPRRLPRRQPRIVRLDGTQLRRERPRVGDHRDLHLSLRRSVRCV